MARRLNEEDPGDAPIAPVCTAAPLPLPPPPSSSLAPLPSAASPDLATALCPPLLLGADAASSCTSSPAATTAAPRSYAVAVTAPIASAFASSPAPVLVPPTAVPSEVAARWASVVAPSPTPSTSLQEGPAHPSDKNLGSPPVTRRQSILASRYLVFGFLAFGVLVLTGSLAFTISSSKTAAPDPDEEWSAGIILRSDWKARPRAGVVLLKTPAQYVVISHTATEECAGKLQCLAIVREVQAQHLRRGFLDITYSFLVGGDGRVYEGRGWGVQSAPRRSSLAVSIVGTFTRVAPSKDQLDATQRLIRVGVKYGYIADNYTLLADFDHEMTDFLITRNDNELVEVVSNWPHWSAGS